MWVFRRTLRSEEGLVVRSTSAPDVSPVIVSAERGVGPSVEGRGWSGDDIVV